MLPYQLRGQLYIPSSIGELVDKITILQIKSKYMVGKPLQNVSQELKELLNILDESNLHISHETFIQLYDINHSLWLIEDELRLLESRSDFGARFIHLARSVYKTNDKRANLKHEININNSSAIVEEKSYPSLTQPE